MGGAMIDENAYGLLIAWHGIEDEEYSLETEEFAARIVAFRELVLGCLRERAPANGLYVLDFGHAVYLEFAQGDESEDPIGWLRFVRARLEEHEFDSALFLSHGGRWLKSDGARAEPMIERVGDMPLAALGAPSEPLRRALYGETLTHAPDDDRAGWGPGLYVDSEAIEALGRRFKNAPTPLIAATATFFRLSG
jgi:hypothetical protein